MENSTPLKDSNFNIEEALKYFNHYVTTYENQYHWQRYQIETWLDDIIYGLGVSIDPSKFKYNDGFCKFKKLLVNYLKEAEK